MAIQLGLARIATLLRLLGAPQRVLPVVHVAGTNGKGSVCALLGSVLAAAGLRVGTFTSPFLVHPRDSIVLAGAPLEPALYDRLRSRIDALNDSHSLGASPFERLTATALDAFRAATPPLDICIVEVGMGGAHDATNVFDRPLLAILTSVDLDHQAFLGSTVAEIAAVKCGIFKNTRPVLVAPQLHPDIVQPIAAAAARSLDSHIYFVDSSNMLPPHTPIGLGGPHQLANASTAAIAARLLSTMRLSDESNASRTIFDGNKFNISEQTIADGLQNVVWHGRMEWLDVPLPGTEYTVRVLADGAHNASSASSLGEYLDSVITANTHNYNHIVFIVGLSRPRDPYRLISHFLPKSVKSGRLPLSVQVIAVPFSSPQDMPWVESVSPSNTAEAVQRLSHDLQPSLSIKACEKSSIQQALETVATTNYSSPPLVVVCGSLYLVSDLYRLIS